MSEMACERKYYCDRKRKPLMRDEKIYFSSTDYGLTEKELEKARLELGETDAKRKQCFQELKSKLNEDRNINYFMEEWYLLRYLRFRKFNFEEAYKTMRYFYTQKMKHPEVFKVPLNMDVLLNYHAFYYMPYVDEQGRVIFIVDFARWNPNEVPFIEALSGLTTIVDIATMVPRCQVNGVVSIWDAKGLSSRHLAEILSPKHLMLFASVCQRCIATRIKLVIFINCNSILRMIFSAVSPLLWKKLRERIILLGSDIKELHKYVSPFLLPTLLGGTFEEKECRIDKEILSNLPFLQYERSFTFPREDESVRL